MLRIVLAFVSGLVLSCGHGPDRCGFAAFAPAPYDHIIEDLGSLEARQFGGVIRSSDIAGELPADLGAKIEVHGQRGFTATVSVGAGGRFEQDLPAGTYCFKLSAPGFRSALGRVRVAPDAVPSELQISLIMSE